MQYHKDQHKPCLHCGNPLLALIRKVGFDRGYFVYFKCFDCGATGPTAPEDAFQHKTDDYQTAAIFYNRSKKEWAKLIKEGV